MEYAENNKLKVSLFNKRPLNNLSHIPYTPIKEAYRNIDYCNNIRKNLSITINSYPIEIKEYQR
jgi:hypothetical protein